MLELRHLYMLKALQANESLAAAAEDLYITPSAVSHQLKELENYYGVQLVNRRQRPLSFTAAGATVLALADSILPQVERTKTDIKRIAHGQTGRLRLASECHSCFDWLMPILNRYRKIYSDVELDFASGFEPEPHQLLLDKDIDLLITTSRLKDPQIRYQTVFDYESKLTLAPTHPLADKEYIIPEDLADEILIAYPVEQDRLDIMSKFLMPAQVKPKSIRTTDLTPMLVQLVASEKGVAALPDWVVAEYERKGWVVSRQLGEHGVYCRLYAAVREDTADTAYMQGFLRLLEGLSKPERLR